MIIYFWSSYWHHALNNKLIMQKIVNYAVTNFAGWFVACDVLWLKEETIDIKLSYK